jgi:hypothetical protein
MSDKKVLLSDSMAREVEAFKQTTGLVRVGSVSLKGFSTCIFDLDDESGRRGFWGALEELIEPEGEEPPPAEIQIVVRLCRMTRYDFDELEEFDGW